MRLGRVFSPDGGRAMRVVFIGPPGSGKGTQANLLRERLGVSCIGTGDILREAILQQTPVGRQAEPFLTQGRLVPDEIVNEIVAERLRRPDRPSSFVLDGYPRNVAQAIQFDKVLKEQGIPLTGVIHFAIDEDEVVKRLAGRGRQDDTELTVRHRLRVFRDASRELLQHYRQQGLLHDVPAVGAIEPLYVRIACLLLQPAA